MTLQPEGTSFSCVDNCNGLSQINLNKLMPSFCKGQLVAGERSSINLD